MTYREIHKEIEENLNKLANRYDLDKIYLDKEIIFEFGSYLEENYRSRRKLYDFKVNCNFPDVDIFLHLFKGGEIYSIKPLRFERIRKLRKLETIAKTYI